MGILISACHIRFLGKPTSREIVIEIPNFLYSALLLCAIFEASMESYSCRSTVATRYGGGRHLLRTLVQEAQLRFPFPERIQELEVYMITILIEPHPRIPLAAMEKNPKSSIANELWGCSPHTTLKGPPKKVLNVIDMSLAAVNKSTCTSAFEGANCWRSFAGK